MSLKESQHKSIDRLKEKSAQNDIADTEYINRINSGESQEIKALWDKYAQARKEFERDYNIFSGQVTDFQEQLRYLIDAKNSLKAPNEKRITFESIADQIGISPKTLSRYNNGHSAPSINVLIMICIALDLDLKQASALATSLGLCFSGTSRAHYAYMYLLENHRGKSIEECNKILTGLYIPLKEQLYPRKRSNTGKEEK